MTGMGISTYHISRSWAGTPLEDGCPCPQEPCGFVDSGRTVPACTQHPGNRVKTIRRRHSPQDCPGERLPEDAPVQPDPGAVCAGGEIPCKDSPAYALRRLPDPGEARAELYDTWTHACGRHLRYNMAYECGGRPASFEVRCLAEPVRWQGHRP